MFLVVTNISIGNIHKAAKANKPDADLVGYAHPTSYQGVLEAVRRELTVILLNLLPDLDSK